MRDGVIKIERFYTNYFYVKLMFQFDEQFEYRSQNMTFSPKY